MQIPGIGNISLFKALRSGSEDNKSVDRANTGQDGNIENFRQSLEQVRQRTIEDSVDLSPAARDAIAALNLENDQSEESVRETARNVASSLSTNLGLSLGLDESNGRNF